MKKSSRILLTLLLMMSMVLTPVLPVSAAAAKTGAKAEKTVTKKKAKKAKTKTKVDKITVNRNKVIIAFKGKVEYKALAATVKDAEGNKLEAKISKKTKSQLKLKVTGLEKGKEYTVTVNGVKLKKEKEFGKVTKKFKVK